MKQSNMFNNSSKNELKISNSLYGFIRMNNIVNINDIVAHIDDVEYCVLQNELKFIKSLTLSDECRLIACYDLDLFWKLEYLYSTENKLYYDLKSLTKSTLFSSLSYNISNYISCPYLKYKYLEVMGELSYYEDDEVNELLGDIVETNLILDTGDYILRDYNLNVVPLGDYEIYLYKVCNIVYNNLPEYFSIDNLNFTRVKYNRTDITKSSIVPFSFEYVRNMCKLGLMGYSLTVYNLMMCDVTMFKPTNLDKFISHGSFSNFNSYAEFFNKLISSREFYRECSEALNQLCKLNNLDEMCELFESVTNISKRVIPMKDFNKLDFNLELLTYLFSKNYKPNNISLPIIIKYYKLDSEDIDTCVNASEFTEGEIEYIIKTGLGNISDDYLILNLGLHIQSRLILCLSGLIPATDELLNIVITGWEKGFISNSIKASPAFLK